MVGESVASALLKYTPEASGKDSSGVCVCVFQIFAALKEKSNEVLHENEGQRVRKRVDSENERDISCPQT